jgi:translation initiation factor IF-2
MSTYRVYEIAKEKNLSSKELISICGTLGIDVKSHSSSIDEKQLELNNNYFTKKTKSVKPKGKDSAKVKEVKDVKIKEDAPKAKKISVTKSKKILEQKEDKKVSAIKKKKSLGHEVKKKCA